MATSTIPVQRIRIVDAIDQEGLTSRSVDLSNYSRRILLLLAGNGGMYLVTVWSGTMNITEIHATDQITVSASGKVLTVNKPSAVSALKYVLIYIN